MIRLLIDGTPIAANAKGVGRYAYHLCLQLAERLPSEWELQVLIHPGSVTMFPDGFRAKLIQVPAASELVHGLWIVPTQARKLKSELLLKTSENAGSVRGIPVLTVCHDVDELIANAQAKKRNTLRVAIDLCKRYLRRKALQGSDAVICNSEFTRRAIQSYYHITSERTALAYCALDPRFYEISKGVDKAAICKKYGLESFILTFATGDERENFRRCPEVAARILNLGVCTCLFIAGVKPNKPYARSLREDFQRLGLVEGKHFIFEEFLGADRFLDLVSLYSAADYYLDLSLHEGFGMQLAEAMACGTTCISSDRGALAEIGDKYALFVDPTNVEEVAQTIKSAYDVSAQLRDNCEQVLYTFKFSWDSVGNTVADLLLQISTTTLPFAKKHF